MKDSDEGLIDAVLTAATNVHRELGPGLLESVYELALMIELSGLGIEARRQVEIPVSYRGQDLGIGFRADIIVADCLLLEIKAIEDFNTTHLAQIMFHKKLLKDGIKRVSI